jgi:ketosteroid isomerase-like protein
MIRALLFSTLLGVAAVVAAPAETSQTEVRILRLEDDWRIAQHKNDSAALLALLAPDVTFIGTSGSLRDRAGYLASRATSWIPRSPTYEYSELRVRVIGSVVIVTGREATTGEGTAFQGRFTHVWAQREGQWQLVAIQRTDIAQ